MTFGAIEIAVPTMAVFFTKSLLEFILMSLVTLKFNSILELKKRNLNQSFIKKLGQCQIAKN